MNGKDLFYKLSNEEIYKLSDEDKIAFAYSFTENMSEEQAKTEITGEDLQEVKDYIKRRLIDQKQAVNSFLNLLESIGDKEEPQEERKSVLDLRKEYPHATLYFFGKDGYELKNVYATDKMERYEVRYYHHEQDGEEWDEQVIHCYYNREREAIMSKEAKAYIMAMELDKVITEATSFQIETVAELERKKQLVAEWERKEKELQAFLNDNRIESVCYGCVYMRGNFNNTEGK